MKVQSGRENDFASERLVAMERYYQLVKKGCSPEQTREDLRLRIEDITQFDFSVFEKRSGSRELS